MDEDKIKHAGPWPKTLYAYRADQLEHGYGADPNPGEICGNNTGETWELGVYKFVGVEKHKYRVASTKVRKTKAAKKCKGNKR